MAPADVTRAAHWLVRSEGGQKVVHPRKSTTKERKGKFNKSNKGFFCRFVSPVHSHDDKSDDKSYQGVKGSGEPLPMLLKYAQGDMQQTNVTWSDERL